MKNQEAMRCLLCKVPMCSKKGCPVHTAIPDCMKLYREDRLEEAGEILFNNNPMTAVTSLICDWKKFCYGSCVLNAKKEPVRWYEIEQEISGAYLFNHHESPVTPNGKTAAIIGAGPAGLSAALFLARSGVNVTVYDSEEKMGGVLRYGIPAFRLDKKYVDAYERILFELGVKFVGNTHVGKDITVESMRQNYDVVLVACGAEKSRTLRIPGEERPNVLYAIDYLKHPSEFEVGEHVIVIGGGNVAMDASRTAVRSGKDTWIYYRKTFENMPANPLEVEEAKEDGVQFRVFQAPVEVREHSVVFCDCENRVDENGKTVTEILKGTEHEVQCDTLLVAASETIDLGVFGEQVPALNNWKFPDTDETNRIKDYDNVWTAGDFQLGARTVVEAVADSKKAVDAMKAYLGIAE